MNLNITLRHIGRIATMLTLALLVISCSKKDEKNDTPVNPPVNPGDNPGGPDQPASNEGMLNGTFTVADGMTVAFSQGNLQYQPSTGLFRFAEEQFDMVGNANKTIGNDTIGIWFDLFGWGTSGYHNAADEYNRHYLPDDYGSYNETVNRNYNYYGFGPSTNMESPDLTGSSANYDWGVYNKISNGGNQVALWRTLTKDEWVYLLTQRSASTISGVANARFAKATIVAPLTDTTTTDIHGLIIFPDTYTHPDGVPSLNRINQTNANYNQSIDYANWKQLETAGCVFLPAAGRREIANRQLARAIVSPNAVGNYWSSTHSDFAPSGGNLAYELLFTSEVVDPSSSNNRDGGRSVRLVRER